MAARVTKQFLQHALQQHDASKKPVTIGTSAKTALLAKTQSLKQQHKPAVAATSKKVRGGAKSSKQQTSSSSSKKKKKKNAPERFLVTAKKEQAHADRTRENVQKLQVRPTDKSQRLMAKVRPSHYERRHVSNQMN